MKLVNGYNKNGYVRGIMKDRKEVDECTHQWVWGAVCRNEGERVSNGMGMGDGHSPWPWPSFS